MVENTELESNMKYFNELLDNIIMNFESFDDFKLLQSFIYFESALFKSEIKTYSLIKALNMHCFLKKFFTSVSVEMSCYSEAVRILKYIFTYDDFDVGDFYDIELLDNFFRLININPRVTDITLYIISVLLFHDMDNFYSIMERFNILSSLLSLYTKCSSISTQRVIINIIINMYVNKLVDTKSNKLILQFFANILSNKNLYTENTLYFILKLGFFDEMKDFLIKFVEPEHILNKFLNSNPDYQRYSLEIMKYLIYNQHKYFKERANIDHFVKHIILFNSSNLILGSVFDMFVNIIPICPQFIESLVDLTPCLLSMAINGSFIEKQKSLFLMASIINNDSLRNFRASILIFCQCGYITLVKNNLEYFNSGKEEILKSILQLLYNMNDEGLIHPSYILNPELYEKIIELKEHNFFTQNELNVAETILSYYYQDLPLQEDFEPAEVEPFIIPECSYESFYRKIQETFQRN